MVKIEAKMAAVTMLCHPLWQGQSGSSRLCCSTASSIELPIMRSVYSKFSISITLYLQSTKRAK